MIKRAQSVQIKINFGIGTLSLVEHLQKAKMKAGKTNKTDETRNLFQLYPQT